MGQFWPNRSLCLCVNTQRSFYQRHARLSMQRMRYTHKDAQDAQNGPVRAGPVRVGATAPTPVIPAKAGIQVAGRPRGGVGVG